MTISHILSTHYGFSPENLVRYVSKISSVTYEVYYSINGYFPTLKGLGYLYNESEYWYIEQAIDIVVGF